MWTSAQENRQCGLIVRYRAVVFRVIWVPIPGAFLNSVFVVFGGIGA
jgi:hypothetical protein